MSEGTTVVLGDHWPDTFGDLIVVENRPQRLHVRSTQLFPIIYLVVGSAALTVFLIRIAKLLPDDSFLDVTFGVVKVNIALLAVAFTGLAIGIPRFGLAYTLDGDERTISQYRVFKIWTRRSDQFEAVDLSVIHDGPVEVLILSLSRRNGKKSVRLGCVRSDGRLPLIAAAPRIAELLKLPLVRHGTVHQSTDTAVRALEKTQSEVYAGDGRDLLINCPKCRTQGAKAVAFEEVERAADVGIVSYRTSWVKCLTCGKKLFSKKRPDDLIGLSAADLERIVVVYVSLYNRAFAVLAILTCIMPFIGLGVGIVATAINFRHRGWLRRLSLAGLFISIIPSALVWNVVHRDHRTIRHSLTVPAIQRSSL